MPRLRFAPLAGALLLLPELVAAQAPVDTAARYARIVLIRPRPGHEAEFESGYKRHLAWHAAHRDPWTWRAWTFLFGERLQLFMDGTFHHTLGALDHPIDPAGDAADNRANVEPHADFVAHGLYERLPFGSATAPDSAPFVVLTTIWLQPDQEAAFRDLFNRPSLQAQAAGQGWYRLVLGGDGPEYLVFEGARSPGAAGALPAPLSAVPAATLGAMVRDVRRELLRYRRDMAYHP